MRDFGRHPVGVKDLDRKNARARRRAVNPAHIAGGGGNAGTTGAVDIVELVLVERKPKDLGPRVELLLDTVPAHFVDEEIAPAEVARLVRIRAPANVGAQVRMLDVHAVVEDGDRDPLPAPMPPRLARIHEVERPLPGVAAARGPCA